MIALSQRILKFFRRQHTSSFRPLITWQSIIQYNIIFIYFISSTCVKGKWVSEMISYLDDKTVIMRSVDSYNMIFYYRMQLMLPINQRSTRHCFSCSPVSLQFHPRGTCTSRSHQETHTPQSTRPRTRASSVWPLLLEALIRTAYLY